MKLLIASDIHGSAYWCSKLMDAYQNEKADRMILLGDIMDHEMHFQKSMIRSECVIC